ncbi:MAG: hypothetical protein K8L97_25130 [Anaerolineae bacterium]|nr:hypothetical protein [Anaerolineae bacterium]
MLHIQLTPRPFRSIKVSVDYHQSRQWWYQGAVITNHWHRIGGICKQAKCHPDWGVLPLAVAKRWTARSGARLDFYIQETLPTATTSPNPCPCCGAVGSLSAQADSFISIRTGKLHDFTYILCSQCEWNNRNLRMFATLKEA